jgi:hypothetical protein
MLAPSRLGMSWFNMNSSSSSSSSSGGGGPSSDEEEPGSGSGSNKISEVPIDDQASSSLAPVHVGAAPPPPPPLSSERSRRAIAPPERFVAGSAPAHRPANPARSRRLAAAAVRQRHARAPTTSAKPAAKPKPKPPAEQPKQTKEQRAKAEAALAEAKSLGLVLVRSDKGPFKSSGYKAVFQTEPGVFKAWGTVRDSGTNLVLLGAHETAAEAALAYAKHKKNPVEPKPLKRYVPPAQASAPGGAVGCFHGDGAAKVSATDHATDSAMEEAKALRRRQRRAQDPKVLAAARKGWSLVLREAKRRHEQPFNRA